MAFVYLHTNLENSKVYVGQTWQSPADRWRMQRRDAEKRIATSRHLNSAIRKYGEAVFDHQILAETTNQQALDNLEKVWIILLQARNPMFGYNLREGGRGGRQSEETRKRVSAYQKQHENAGRFQKGHVPVGGFQLGVPAWNMGKTFRHGGSFGSGHAPYCNHLGGFKSGDFCVRCGKEKLHV